LQLDLVDLTIGAKDGGQLDGRLDAEPRRDLRVEWFEMALEERRSDAP
jgi:hypothetical protein